MQKWFAKTDGRKQYSQIKATKTSHKKARGDDLGKKTRKNTGLRLRGSVYYADTTANGYRISQRIGRVSEREAKAILAELVAQAFKEQYFPDKKQDICIRYVLNEYGTKRLQYKKSFSTRVYLLKHLDRLLGSRVAKELRISEVEEYRRIRLSEKKTIGGKETDKTVSIKTVNEEVKELCSALKWAVKERLIEFNPIAGIEHLPLPEPKKIMLDKGHESGREWLRLYNAIGERSKSGKLTIRGMKDRLKFLIQYKTGMRIGEVNAIEYSWIDQIARYIYLPASATKSNKARNIPVDIEVIRAINDFREAVRGSRYEHDKYLFYNSKTGTHEISSFKAFKNAVLRAGLSPDVTSHALRRTRGTIWDNIDERASMEVLGHSDDKVHRKHYTIVSEERIRALADNSDNIPTIKSKDSVSL